MKNNAQNKKYELAKEEINERIYNKFDCNIDILKESFIQYFGKEYELIINNKFNELFLEFHVADKLCNYISELQNEIILNNKYLLEMLPVVTEIYKNSLDTKCPIETKINNRLLNLFSLSDIYEELENEELLSLIGSCTVRNNNDELYCIIVNIDDNTKRIISIPTLLTDDKMFFKVLTSLICADIYNNEVLYGATNIDQETDDKIKNIMSYEIRKLYNKLNGDILFDDCIISRYEIDVITHDEIYDFYKNNESELKDAILLHKEYKNTYTR